jgi:hypothetical protein
LVLRTKSDSISNYCFPIDICNGNAGCFLGATNQILEYYFSECLIMRYDAKNEDYVLHCNLPEVFNSRSFV